MNNILLKQGPKRSHSYPVQKYGQNPSFWIPYWILDSPTTVIMVHEVDLTKLILKTRFATLSGIE